MESGSQDDVVYTDFSKAFDRARHSFLIRKLPEIGFYLSTLLWIDSYLQDRLQHFNISGLNFATFIAYSGVPQGSHLGPVLFNLIINDVLNIFVFSKCLLYDGDMKIFGTVISIKNAHLIRRDVNAIVSCCKLNCLS